jgi:two-component system chemotaxis response regulator CheY
MTKTILIVDDSATVRTQVGATLKGVGFDVVEASDGEDALAKLAHGPPLHLVICDVNMPHMSGLELLEKMRGELKNELPVLMLTTEGQVALMERAKRAGAKGWMVKPFKPSLLVAAAKKLAG